jgi:predicted dehydrogenase
MSALRLGIIGAGTISQSVHLPSIRRAGLELRWVCDLSPSRAAEVAAALGTRGTSRPDEVFADPQVDAVLIATPGSHAELAMRALRAGKHVLAEKPLALTLGEVDDLARLAAETRRVVQVGYMKMYDPLTAKAKAELEELDGVRLVRVTVAHPADLPQIAHLRMQPAPRDADIAEIERAEAAEIANSRRALPGASDDLLEYYRNVLNGSVIHEFSLLRALGLALPARWTAQVFPELGGSEPACLLAEAAVGDARYVVSWNWLPEYPEYDEELKVLASNGRLEYHLAKPYLLEDRSRLRVDRNEGLRRIGTDYLETYETGFLRQLDAFATAVTASNEGETPVIAADLQGARADIEQVQLLAQAIGASLGLDVTVEAGA